MNFSGTTKERCLMHAYSHSRRKESGKKGEKKGETVAQNLVNRNTKKSNERIVRILN